jgi:hypothetical protein
VSLSDYDPYVIGSISSPSMTVFVQGSNEASSRLRRQMATIELNPIEVDIHTAFSTRDNDTDFHRLSIGR